MNTHSDIGSFQQDVIDEARSRPGAYTPALLRRWLVDDTNNGTPPAVPPTVRPTKLPRAPRPHAKCGYPHTSGRCPTTPEEAAREARGRWAT